MENEQNQNLNQIPQQSVLEPVSNSENSSSLHSKWLKVGVVVVVALLLLGGAYVLNKNNSGKPTSTSVTVKLTPTTDPTATWKTYNSSAQEMSFKYPPTLKFDNPEIESFTNAEVGLIGGTPNNVIGSVVGGPNLYVNIWTLEEANKWSVLSQVPNDGKKITVDGIEEPYYIGGAPTTGTEMIIGPFQRGSLIYQIMYTGFKESVNKDIPAEFMQIISTFKFTNPATATPTPNPTANWKTYSNSQYGFSFKYNSSYLKEGSGSISGPSSPTEPLVTFGHIDPQAAGTDRNFDGFSITIVRDTSNLSFNQYIDNEIAVFQKDSRGISVENRNNFSLGNLTGGAYLKDTNYDINMYYFPFPDNKNFIVFGQTSVNSNFNNQFNQILSTFKFTN